MLSPQLLGVLRAYWRLERPKNVWPAPSARGFIEIAA